MGWVEDKLEALVAAIVEDGEKTRAQLAANYAQSLRGSRIDGALARPIRPNAQNYGAGGRLVGWSLRAAGGEVVLTFHDGFDAGGDVLGAVDLAAGTSQTIAANPVGVSFADGLYVEVTGAGTPVGSVWIGAAD